MSSSEIGRFIVLLVVFVCLFFGVIIGALWGEVCNLQADKANMQTTIDMLLSHIECADRRIDAIMPIVEMVDECIDAGHGCCEAEWSFAED